MVQSTHDFSRGMLAPFDRKAPSQGKNENYFRPYLITPFAVSNCVRSEDAGLVSVSDKNSFPFLGKKNVYIIPEYFVNLFLSL